MIQLLVLLFLCLSKSSGAKNAEPVVIAKCVQTDVTYTFAVAIFGGYEDSVIRFVGSGTLLSAHWVLTTSKNILANFTYYNVVAGAHRIDIVLPAKTTRRKFVQVAEVLKYFIPERAMTKEKAAYPIALMQLIDPIHISKGVTYVRWATYANLINKTLEAVCANALTVGYCNSTYSIELYCPHTPLMSRQDCSNAFKKDNVSLYNTDCIYGMREACFGSEGGPVMCNDVQFGVLSSRRGSENEGFPTVFTKVYKFAKFIRTTMKQNRLLNTLPSVLPTVVQDYYEYEETSFSPNSIFLNMLILFLTFILHLSI